MSEEEKQEQNSKKLSLLLILVTNLGSVIGGYVAGQQPAEPVEITCQIAQEIVKSDACEQSEEEAQATPEGDTPEASEEDAAPVE